MANDVKSNSNAESSPDLRAIMGDVETLKHDLATLIRHRKDGIAEDIAHARGAVGQLGDQAVHAYENLAAQGQRSVKAIGRQVEEQPVLSLLLAFAAGFIGSRMLSR